MQSTWQTRKGPDGQAASSVTSSAGRARMLWAVVTQVGLLPSSSSMAVVTPTRLSLLTLRKYSEKGIQRFGGVPSETQPQLNTKTLS